MAGSFGLRTTPDGQGSAWGNIVIGIRNPAAPPLVVHHEPDGQVWAEFVLGATYEGPAGHVHGGVCALVLDHVLGATAHQPGRPAYTGTLTLRYVRGTPWDLYGLEARVERVEGAKTFAGGSSATRTESRCGPRVCSSSPSRSQGLEAMSERGVPNQVLQPSAELAV